jgi:hypothetical protein
VIAVPRILLGDYLAQSRAMHLANAYLERSQCLASRQTFICATDTLDLAAPADRKMVIFYVYLRYFTKKSQLYRTDTQIKKLVCKGKTFAHCPTPICVSVYFLKKSQPEFRMNYFFPCCGGHLKNAGNCLAVDKLQLLHLEACPIQPSPFMHYTVNNFPWLHFRGHHHREIYRGVFVLFFLVGISVVLPLLPCSSLSHTFCLLKALLLPEILT